MFNRSYYAMFYAVLALLTRQIGDYRELSQLDREQAEEILNSAEQFIEAVNKFLR